MSTLASFSISRSPWLALALALLLSGCDPLSLASGLFGNDAGTSVLTLLDTDGRRLKLDQEVRGSLSASDYVGLNNNYLEAWELKGEPGQKIWIDLTSDDFDSYLYVVGPGLTEVLRDDDSGGACHARIELSVLERGTFRVVASTSGSQSTGTYRLRASEQPSPGATISCGGVDPRALAALSFEGREVEWGMPATGYMTGGEPSIENSRPVQLWSVRGVAGERATIRLESDDYDSYLYFGGPGMAETLTNDDGGEGLDSELTVTFPETGTYMIGAAALSSGANGSYTLTVTEPIRPTALSTDGRQLRVGSVVQGALTDASVVIESQPSEAWAFDARAGQRVTFELTSDDFDSFLRVVGPGLGDGLTDDDSAGDLDSRLSVTFPQSGEYRVIASSLGGSTGSYTLIVR